MRQQAFTFDLSGRAVDLQSMRGWHRLVLTGLMVCLPVPMLAASGLAVPLPSIVYRVAVGVAERTQAVAVGVPGFDAVVDKTTEVPLRGRIRLSSRELALAGDVTGVQEAGGAAERVGSQLQSAAVGRRTKRGWTGAGPVEPAESRGSSGEGQESTGATGGDVGGELSEGSGPSEAPSQPTTERPSSAPEPDRVRDAPSSPAHDRPNAPAADSPPRPAEPTPPKDDPKGGSSGSKPSPPPPPPPPPPLVLPPVFVLPPVDSPPELLPRTAEEQLEDIAADLDAIARENPGTPLADKVEDALAEVESALAELRKTPSDVKTALGKIEGAVNELEQLVEEGLFGSADGTNLMNRAAGTARLLAVEAIDDARARGGAVDKMIQAEAELRKGDADRALGMFKRAVGKYRNAFGAAEGA